MIETVKALLKAFGLELRESDEFALSFAVRKAENTIKNDINADFIPDGLFNVAVCMAAGEFLTAKKTFAPEDIACLDLDAAVKQIQTGDTSVTFAAGDGSLTDEQRLDSFLNYLLNAGRSELSCYRKIRW